MSKYKSRISSIIRDLSGVTERSIYFMVLTMPILLFIVALNQYCKTFGIDLSSDPSKWGVFGDYFGGFTNPILTYISILCFLFTFKQNSIVIKDNSKQLTHQRSEALRQRTFEIYQTWVNPEMQKIRSETLAVLRSKINRAQLQSKNNMSSNIVFIGKMRADPVEKNIYYSLETITYLFENYAYLYKKNLIDRPLLFELLGRSVREWLEMYDKIDFRRTSRDTSKISSAENQKTKELISSLKKIFNIVENTQDMTDGIGPPDPNDLDYGN
jgi:hypothetical protein